LDHATGPNCCQLKYLDDAQLHRLLEAVTVEINRRNQDGPKNETAAAAPTRASSQGHPATIRNNKNRGTEKIPEGTANLIRCMDLRKQSVDHEETWLIVAGFLLRPGFGVTADNFRIDSLWRLRDQGLGFLGKRIKSQECILWRRVAGGLTRERQEQILVPELDAIRTEKTCTRAHPARGIAGTRS
jgi:hypothetical protein